MSGPSSTIVGRDPELREVVAFLERLESGLGALVLEGAAGIGKTTIWSAGVLVAEDRGHRVVTTRAAESEARWSYAALCDLFGSVLERHSVACPPRSAARWGPRSSGRRNRHAAGSAGRLAGHGRRGVEPRRRVTAGHRGRRCPVARWPSARVLSFVRRLFAENRSRCSPRCGSLRARRETPSGSIEPFSRSRSLRSDRWRGCRSGSSCATAPGWICLIPPWSDSIGSAAGTRCSRSRSLVLALARERAPSGITAGPVPDDLQQLLSARLAACPSAGRLPLLAVAAMSQPTAQLVLDAAATDEARSTASTSRRGGRDRARGRTRAVHPPAARLDRLLERLAGGSSRAPPPARALLTDPEERARHLALAAEGPDGEVAGALEGAARYARARGAPDAAAELAEQALRDHAADELGELRRRRLEEPSTTLMAATRAARIGCSARRSAGRCRGPERAQMLYRLSSMSWMNLIAGVRATGRAGPPRGGRGSRPAKRHPGRCSPGSRST